MIDCTESSKSGHSQPTAYPLNPNPLNLDFQKDLGNYRPIIGAIGKCPINSVIHYV